jgi:hypothetical protein
METVDKLAALSEELDTHCTRLRERAAVITALAEQQTDPGVKELLKLVAESFTEQVDTGLDFQQETLGVISEALADVGNNETGLLPEEAEQLTSTLTEYRAMLDELIKNLSAGTVAEKAILQGKLERCVAAITLVEEVTLADDDDDAEEEDSASSAN